MKYELLAVDMDGTLLNTRNEVSERTKQALKLAADQGVKVVIASGRVFTSARRYAALLGLHTPIIACNGAIIRHAYTNEVLYLNAIGREDGVRAMEICREADLYFHFYDQDTLYVEERWYPYVASYYYGLREKSSPAVECITVSDGARYVQEQDLQLLKLTMVDPELKKLDQVKPLFQEISTLALEKSWVDNLELMNRGVSKGAALKKLGEYYGIPPEKMIAFGDNVNDLSMLSYVGASVAMGNSEPAIQARARYVTATNDEDGVALGIEKYVLE